MAMAENEATGICHICGAPEDSAGSLDCGDIADCFDRARERLDAEREARQQVERERDEARRGMAAYREDGNAMAERCAVAERERDEARANNLRQQQATAHAVHSGTCTECIGVADGYDEARQQLADLRAKYQREIAYLDTQVAAIRLLRDRAVAEAAVLRALLEVIRPEVAADVDGTPEGCDTYPYYVERLAAIDAALAQPGPGAAYAAKVRVLVDAAQDVMIDAREPHFPRCSIHSENGYSIGCDCGRDAEVHAALVALRAALAGMEVE